MFSKLLILIFIFFAFEKCIGSNNKEEQLQRSKRHLLFPIGGGIFKLIVGLGIPTKLGIRQSMALGMNFQFQYSVPENITQLIKPYPPIIARERERRETNNTNTIPSDRALFYLGLEEILSSNGLNGRSCVLRAICDNAMHPLKHESNGLFGELMHIALTPATLEHLAAESETNDPYVDAQRAGEYGVDCASSYPDCPAAGNLLNTLSVLDN